MGIPWSVVLKNVPRTDVIRNAPRVAEGARKLWNAVAGKPSAPEVVMPGVDATMPASLAELQARVTAL